MLKAKINIKHRGTTYNFELVTSFSWSGYINFCTGILLIFRPLSWNSLYASLEAIDLQHTVFILFKYQIGIWIVDKVGCGGAGSQILPSQQGQHGRQEEQDRQTGILHPVQKKAGRLLSPPPRTGHCINNAEVSMVVKRTLYTKHEQRKNQVIARKEGKQQTLQMQYNNY